MLHDANRPFAKALAPSPKPVSTFGCGAVNTAPMSDRVFFSLTALAIIAMVALALVTPQGQGRRSPAPFGHETAADALARQPKLRPAGDQRSKKPGIL